MRRRAFALFMLATACGGNDVTFSRRSGERFNRGRIAVTSGAVPFPATVMPAVWLDGSRQAYSDLAGTVPISSGLIRRINEAAPLSAAWTTPADDYRPLTDGNSLRFEIQNVGGGNELNRASAAVGVSADACTLVASYVARDNAYAGPLMGIFRCDDQKVGIRVASNQVWVYYGASSTWFTGVTVAHGQRNTIAVRYSPTGVDLSVNAGGVITTASLSAAIAASSVAGAWRAGVDGTGNLYGSIPQALAVGRRLTDAELTSLSAWAHAQPAPVAYPTDRPLIAFVGDSITRMTAADYGLGYPFLSLRSARTAGYLAEVCNTAVGGTGVTGLLAPISENQSLLLRASAFYSGARSRNVMVIALGTNDLANGNSVAYTLNGTGAAAGSGLYPAIDYAVAQGWRVIVIVPGPRTDVMTVSQATYDAARTSVCNDLVANAGAHNCTVVDTRGIANFGGPTDSNNVTYYSVDKVHPINAGHALLAPSVAAAIQSLLA